MSNSKVKYYQICQMHIATRKPPNQRTKIKYWKPIARDWIDKKTLYSKEFRETIIKAVNENRRPSGLPIFNVQAISDPPRKGLFTLYTAFTVEK